MSRYIIETFSDRNPRLVIKVVFLSQGYSKTWLRNSKGAPTIPYVQLEKLLLRDLQSQGGIGAHFFDDYRSQTETALLRQLRKKGITERAPEVARQRAADICQGLRAVIVEDLFTGSLRVKCLNKDQQVATFNPQTDVITVENEHWQVGPADFPLLHVGDLSGAGSGASAEGGKKRGNTRKRFRKWWHRNGYYVHAIIFFVVLAIAIIGGMLTLRNRLQKPVPAAAVVADSVTIDSVAAGAAGVKPNNDSIQVMR